jgi:hypothetical protein
MAEPAQSRPGRRVHLSSVRRSGQPSPPGEHGVIGLLRAAIDPDRYLIGTIAVILSFTVPVTMVSALWLGYPEVCWALIATATCWSVTVALRARRRITKNYPDDD